LTDRSDVELTLTWESLLLEPVGLRFSADRRGLRTGVSRCHEALEASATSFDGPYGPYFLAALGGAR
jgi:hypothetical protein